MDATPRVTLVHDWLTGMRGGEKVLDVFARRWPAAELFTLLHAPGSVAATIEDRPIRQSWLGRLPGAARWYRYALPLMPRAIESFRIPPCDLVLSSSHCVAKGVRPPHGVPHVCYCFTPMRYVWQMREAYFPRRDTLKSRLLHRVLDSLQEWDRRTSERVTHFIGISATVRERIRDCYGRDAAVIYPPVDTDFYTPAKVRRDAYYLVVSALAPYKRIDLAIEACNWLKKHLLIIGSGPEERKLRVVAGPTVQFAGWQPDEAIRDHLRRCRALLFPGEEDFGIVPVEANACGTPVLCFGRGGATETVVPPGSRGEPTGLWFERQDVDSLSAAIERFERVNDAFNPSVCQKQAHRFNRHRFEREIAAFVDEALGRGALPLLRAA
jgi:glycosyltransferase involved in cell wall biosynthesis